jgi:hypothetical protein
MNTATTLAESPFINRVTVRPTADDRALVSVTLPAVRLAGLWARRGADGRVKLQAPRTGANDEYPAYALQPGFAELIADAVATLWAQADAEREAEAALMRPGRQH